MMSIAVINDPSSLEFLSRTFSNLIGSIRWHDGISLREPFFPLLYWSWIALFNSPTANSTIAILNESFVVGLSQPSHTHRLGVLSWISLHVRLLLMGVKIPACFTPPVSGPARDISE